VTAGDRPGGPGGWITPAVERAVGASLAAEALAHNTNSQVTRGIWRVRGTGGSAVLKVIGPARGGLAHWAGGDDPAHWHFWRREPDLYASWLGGLDGPVRAPRLLERVERDGEIGLWLEDAGPVPAWSVDRLAAAARRLGAWQGALLGSRPSVPSLSRGFLRAYTLSRPVEPFDWDEPRAAAVWPGPLRRGLARMWECREDLVALVEACPRVLCHLDVWPVNMFDRPEALVLADWAFTGDGALGEDLANLVPDALFDGVVRTDDVPAFADELVAAYLAGLTEAGFRGDPGAVRRAVAAAGAAKFTWLAPRMLGRLRAGQPLRTSFYDPDSSDEEVLERRRPVFELLAGWAASVL
jgi:hypothetical protein